jgi:glycerol-3-phosphate dehydrogenase (NAD(P)+)
MVENTSKIAVIGAGSWGTALALLLARKNLDVALWGHRESHVEALRSERENRSYLPGFPFPKSLHAESDLARAVSGAHTVVMVVPSHSCREVFRQMVVFLRPGVRIISAIKGIENETLQTMSEVIVSVLAESGFSGDIPVGVLSGPSFALEVAKQLPTAVSIGFADIDVAQEQQQLFGTSYFRVYTSVDVLGLELSGALKNVIAIATGMCDGLNFGLNARAALITRGLAEIQRLGVKMGADPATFAGLSGMGDLLLTCTGSLSRNRTVGLGLGEGKKLDEVVAELGMVAEGVKTTRSGYNLARREEVEMPILEEVYKILYEDEPCLEAVRSLLGRELKAE